MLLKAQTVRRIGVLYRVVTLISALLLALLPIGAVNAYNTDGIPAYVRAVDKNVYFYTQPSTAHPLFAVIPTYYLKVVGAEGEYWQVELGEEAPYHTKLCGYVLAARTTNVYEVPIAPLYPLITVEVTSSAARLLLVASEGGKSVITAAYGQRCGYYGKLITTDKEWYYVGFYGNLGYVDASLLSMPTITPHPTPIATPQPPTVVDEPPDEVPTANEGERQPYFDGVQLALILLITIPTLVIIVVMITPERHRNRTPVTINYDSIASGTGSNANTPKPRYYDDNL